MSRPARPSPSRRSFVQLLGGVAGVFVAPVNFAGCGVEGTGPVTRGSTWLPTPDQPLTPTDQFYVNTNFTTPAVPARWQLHVEGLVDRPMAFDLDALLAMPQVTREVTLECVGNYPDGSLISSAPFTGVRLRDVLAAAGVSDRARGIRLLGLDGFPSYLPIAIADPDPDSIGVDGDGEALLVHAIHGEPLPIDHGAPLRALLPGRFGMFSIKWLDSITLTREYATYGSLGELVNFVDGTTRVRSRIDTVRDGQVVRPGVELTLTGIAATPGIGVGSVEVDVGDGWQPAELTFDPLAVDRSPFLWSLWRFVWTPTEEGDVVVRVRARDLAGNTQDDEADFPYDSSAIHRLVLHVVASG